jgi:hypothetical protein
VRPNQTRHRTSTDHIKPILMSLTKQTKKKNNNNNKIKYYKNKNKKAGGLSIEGNEIQPHFN